MSSGFATWAATSSDAKSSPGSSRFDAVNSRQYRQYASIFSAISTCSFSVGFPQENAFRSLHQFFNSSSSASGNPMNRNTVSPGRGKANASMNSVGCGPASISSISSWLRRTM